MRSAATDQSDINKYCQVNLCHIRPEYKHLSRLVEELVDILPWEHSCISVLVHSDTLAVEEDLVYDHILDFCFYRNSWSGKHMCPTVENGNQHYNKSKLYFL